MLMLNNSLNDEFAQHVDLNERSFVLFDAGLISWLLLCWIEYSMCSFEMNSLISSCVSRGICLSTIFTAPAFFAVTFNNDTMMSNV